MKTNLKIEFQITRLEIEETIQIMFNSKKEITKKEVEILIKATLKNYGVSTSFGTNGVLASYHDEEEITEYITEEAKSLARKLFPEFYINFIYEQVR